MSGWKVKKPPCADDTFSLTPASSTDIKTNTAGGEAWGMALPAPCLMPPWVLPVSGCQGQACAAGGPETLCAEDEGEEGGGGGAVESHKQMLHPKEEQHASPSGHLFSQVCSPDVIKIGAAQPLHAALLPSRTKTVLAGARAREVSKQLCRVFFFLLFGADGADDEKFDWGEKGEM